jgi:tRNA G37 N-methylase TrmD
MKKAEELAVITRTYDLVLWSCNHPRIMSWISHAGHANTYRLRTDLFCRMPFQRAATKPSSPAGRDVQQSTGERPLGEP